MRRTSERKPTPPPPPFPGACALQQAGEGAPAGRRGRRGRSWRAGCCWQRGSAVGTPCGRPRSALQPAGPPPLRGPGRQRASRLGGGGRAPDAGEEHDVGLPALEPVHRGKRDRLGRRQPAALRGHGGAAGDACRERPECLWKRMPGVGSSAGWRAGRDMDRRARRAGRHGLQPAAPTCWKVRRSSASCARYGVSTATSPRSALWRAARPAVEVRMRSRGASELEPAGKKDHRLSAAPHAPIR